MNYLFGFSGRIGRLQWWGGQTIILAGFIMSMIAAGAFTSSDLAEAFFRQDGMALMFAITILVLGIWINLAVTVKRYHDRGKSGWWFFCSFIPFIGPFWQLIECGFLSGTLGGNDYGPPRGRSVSTAGLEAEIAAMQGKAAPAVEKTSPFAFLQKSETKAGAAAPATGGVLTTRKPTRRPPMVNGKPAFGRRGV